MSSGDPVETLRQKLQDDDSLRKRFREDPEGVMTEHGLTVDEPVRARLAKHDVRNMSEDDLTAKLSAPNPARTLLTAA